MSERWMTVPEQHEFWGGCVRESLAQAKGGRIAVCTPAMTFIVREVAEDLNNFEYYVLGSINGSPYCVIDQEKLSYFDRIEQKVRTIKWRIPLR